MGMLHDCKIQRQSPCEYRIHGRLPCRRAEAELPLGLRYARLGTMSDGILLYFRVREKWHVLTEYILLLWSMYSVYGLNPRQCLFSRCASRMDGLVRIPVETAVPIPDAPGRSPVFNKLYDEISETALQSDGLVR